MVQMSFKRKAVAKFWMQIEKNINKKEKICVLLEYFLFFWFPKFQKDMEVETGSLDTSYC